MLLVLGCCFFFGGLKHKEQRFNSTSAIANMSLLLLSSLALVLPTPLSHAAVSLFSLANRSDVGGCSVNS